MPEYRPAVVAGVSMRDLLAASAAAKTVSMPPRADEERPEGAPDRADEAATAARGRQATTDRQTQDGITRPLPRSA
jgi:hypothetical protein